MLHKGQSGKRYIFRSVKQNKNMIQCMFLVYNQEILQPHNAINTKRIKKIWFVYVLLGFSVIVLFICMFNLLLFTVNICGNGGM